MITVDFLLQIAEDAFFAAIAGAGFALISNPPFRTLAVSALLAAIGHSLRFVLMNADSLHTHICLASFVASLVIGFLAVGFSRWQGVSVEVYAFPSLLPMIPGMFAYRTMQSLTVYLKCNSETDALHYINLFFYNGITTMFVLFLLVLGSVIPMFMLRKMLFSSNRKQQV